MTLVSTTNPSDLARTLKARLAGGVVSFTFTKLDGDDRPASGTTAIELIPLAFRPIASGRRQSPDSIPYFDLDKMGWRSCKADRIVSIDD